MDSISLDTREEYEEIKQIIQQGKDSNLATLFYLSLLK